MLGIAFLSCGGIRQATINNAPAAVPVTKQNGGQAKRNIDSEDEWRYSVKEFDDQDLAIRCKAGLCKCSLLTRGLRPMSELQHEIQADLGVRCRIVYEVGSR